MNTTPFTFSFLQLYANPCAWLPALAQTTPFLQLLFRQTAHHIVSATKFIRTYNLQIFTLQIDFALYRFDKFLFSCKGVFVATFFKRCSAASKFNCDFMLCECAHGF